MDNVPWTDEALDGFKGLRKRMAEHDVSDRIDEINAWRAKADTAFSNISNAVNRIEKQLEAKSAVPRTYLTILIGSLGAIGFCVSFYVNSMINNTVNPITAELGSLVSVTKSQGELLGRMEDGLNKGRDDRITEELLVRDRLTRLEIHLDDMRKWRDKGHDGSPVEPSQ